MSLTIARALGCEGLCDGAADAARGASHQRHLVLQSVHAGFSFGSLRGHSGFGSVTRP
jgi:hypothetical protein